ncbi:hypothetical protein [Streptosporangium canum]|uniref:hypothetical protein n=1 Tax=Streptosporangium canum TaxID=324952 RepID=UPI0037AFC0A1
MPRPTSRSEPSDAWREFPAGYDQDPHTVPLTLWFLAVITAIGVRFWSYWSTLL